MKTKIMPNVVKDSSDLSDTSEYLTVSWEDLNLYFSQTFLYFETVEETQEDGTVKQVKVPVGWNPNVGNARNVLASLKLSATGKPEVDKVKRAIVKKAGQLFVKSLELAKGDVSLRAEMEAEAEIEIARDTAKALCNVVIAKHGTHVAEFLAEYLLDAIDAIAKNQAKAAQANDDNATDTGTPVQAETPAQDESAQAPAPALQAVA